MLALAGVAGFVDAVGLLTLSGLFTAHMSGNTARLGVDLGEGKPGAALPLAFAVIAFVVGVMLGAACEQAGSDAGLSRTLTVEAVVLAALMVYGGIVVGDRSTTHSITGFYVPAGLAVLAMGTQASSVPRMHGQPLRTTYISGVLTSLGRALVRRGDQPALFAGIAALYLVGAVVGAAAHTTLGLWSLGLPIAVLCAAAGGERRRFRRLAGVSGSRV